MRRLYIHGILNLKHHYDIKPQTLIIHKIKDLSEHEYSTTSLELFSSPINPSPLSGDQTTARALVHIANQHTYCDCAWTSLCFASATPTYKEINVSFSLCSKLQEGVFNRSVPDSLMRWFPLAPNWRISVFEKR